MGVLWVSREKETLKVAVVLKWFILWNHHILKEKITTDISACVSPMYTVPLQTGLVILGELSKGLIFSLFAVGDVCLVS